MKTRTTRPTVGFRGRRIALAVFAALVILTGVMPTLAQGTPVVSATPANAASSFSPEIRWATCEAEEFTGSQCGTVVVAMDWSQPNDQTAELSLVVRPADNQQARIGVLLLNNGSGGSAIEQLRLALE